MRNRFGPQSADFAAKIVNRVIRQMEASVTKFVDIVNLLHNSSCLCVDQFFLLRALLLELGEFRLFDYLVLFEEKKKQEKVAKRALREDAGNRPEEQGSDR